MAHLIACMGHDTENQDIVGKIIYSKVFDIVYLICDADVKENFILRDESIKSLIKINYVLIDDNDAIDRLNDDIYASLKKGFANDKIQDLELAINISSGKGRLHAALISAVVRLGYGIRIVDLDKDGDVVAL
jgi:hypothetical protein